MQAKIYIVEEIKKETLPVHGQNYCNCATNAQYTLDIFKDRNPAAIYIPIT